MSFLNMGLITILIFICIAIAYLLAFVSLSIISWTLSEFDKIF